jgi:hypothetical protein
MSMGTLDNFAETMRMLSLRAALTLQENQASG